MAVDLPPVLPPQAGVLESLPQANSAIAADYGRYRLLISGSALLDAEQIAEIVQPAQDLNQALALLARAYYAAGYPAAQLIHTSQHQDVHVVVRLNRLSETQVDAPLTPYFADLPGETPLRARALEPRRVLASLHADRAGLRATPVLRPDGHGGAQLRLETMPDRTPTQLDLSFDNGGDRYADRHLAQLEFRTGSRSGDEFQIGVRSGLDGLNDGRYAAHELAWSRVTPWGIFGAGARYTDYRQTVAGPVIEGEFWVGNLHWLTPLYADFDSRWNLQGQLDRSRYRESAAGLLTQDELYSSAEIASTYHRREQWLGLAWELDAAVAARQGLGDETATAAALDYQLLRPALRMKLHVGDAAGLTLEASAQFSDDVLPEQQQWVLGGIGNLASQRPGVAIGDEGHLLRAVGELGRYSWQGIELRPRVFAARGAARLTGAPDQPMLADAGIELALSAYGWLHAGLIRSWRLDEREVSQRALERTEAELLFTLRVGF